MNNTFLDLSKKLDEDQITKLKDLHEVITSTGIPYFIIGAYARDLIMEYGFDIKSPRATQDTDIAIQIATWPDYSRLKKTLKEKIRRRPNPA